MLSCVMQEHEIALKRSCSLPQMLPSKFIISSRKFIFRVNDIYCAVVAAHDFARTRGRHFGPIACDK